MKTPTSTVKIFILMAFFAWACRGGYLEDYPQVKKDLDDETNPVVKSLVTSGIGSKWTIESIIQLSPEEKVAFSSLSDDDSLFIVALKAITINSFDFTFIKKAHNSKLSTELLEKNKKIFLLDHAHPSRVFFRCPQFGSVR